MTQSEDLTEAVAKGAVKGTLDWTLEQIKIFAKKFRDKDTAFIEDSDTINLVKEQKKSGEWELYKNYI